MGDVRVDLFGADDPENPIASWVTDDDGEHRPVEDELSFAELREANVSRATRWHPGFPSDDSWTVADWSNAMGGEAGEAQNVVKKLRRLETHGPGVVDPPKEQLLVMLAEELADTVTYADLLAAKLGIDLGAAVRKKFNKVSALQGFPEKL